MILKKENDNFYWFKCPECKVIGHIDKDQAEGKVSIKCDNPAVGCGFHQTKNWLKEKKS